MHQLRESFTGYGGQVTEKQTEATERIKQAENALMGCNYNIEQLEGAVANLIRKINPVLIPEGPLSEGKGDCALPRMCPLAETVYGFSHALERLRHVVDEAASRVDI